jgi:cell division protein FtsW
MLRATGKREHHLDYFFLGIVIILTIFGLAMLGSASSNLGKIKFNDTYYYLKHQIFFGLSFGIVGFAVGYFLHYSNLKKGAFIFLLISLAALVLVFTPLGLQARNTSRWLRLGPLSFQPAELMKLAFLVYLAAWLSNPKFKRATDFQTGLVPFLILCGIIAGLLILQPATSTVVILLFAALAVYLMSGAPLKYIGLFLICGAVVIGLVVYATPYRRARVLGFLDQSADAQGKNYQVNQALIAIGSGGTTGLGYGQSATKMGYLPTPTDDSIFAVVAEELGFVGATSLIAIFAMYSFRLFWLAKRISDRFGRLLLIGFGTIVALQAFVNMAAISGFIPLTGVPLPFVSYGGTALAIFLTMSGISLNISKYA